MHQYLVSYQVKVNGSILRPEVQIVDITVEQNLHLPDMFVIRVLDPAEVHQHTGYFDILDRDTFPIGGEVDIDLGYESSTEPITKGEITAVELDIPEEGGAPMVIVRGYNRAHRLHRGRQSKSYQNVTDSDLAAKLARDAGLQANTDATSQVHDYLFQSNQTSWEFLRDRAIRIGYEMYVDDRTLHFRKPQNKDSSSAVLELWKDLMSFRVKMSSANQVAEVVVRAWDPQSKEAIVGRASHGQLAPEIGMGKTGAAFASPFGNAKVYVVNKPVDSQTEATNLAQAVYDHLDGSFIQAEGTSPGNPKIKPGATIELKNVGRTPSGKYYVSAATHRVSAGAYHTTFVVSGRQSNSLLELVDPRSDGLALPSVVVGVVTDNTDPEGNQGRVKVKFPWMVDDDQSWWARIASPMAGPNRGFYFLPEVDDEVLVAFELGDVTRPYILGALWNGKDAPPKPNSGVISSSKVNERIIKTRAGHVISLDDTDGSEKISIIDKTGKNLILIESSSNKITIQAEGDVNVKANGKVEVNAKGNVDVETQASATVKAQANVDVQATGNATVKATGNASVQANGNLDLKGAMVNIEAQGMMSIKASGPLTLKGAIVNIN